MTLAEPGRWVGVLLAVAACGDEPKPSAGAPSTTTSAATTAPAPMPPPPYGPGPWTRASAGDVQAHRRLAELYDGQRLGAWAKRGARAGIALEALVYAEDAELAFGALAEILETQEARRIAVLDVVYRLALRPPRQTEALDPPGLARLLDQLKQLASHAPAGPVRTRAVSAWRGFARAGYVGPPPTTPP